MLYCCQFGWFNHKMLIIFYVFVLILSILNVSQKSVQKLKSHLSKIQTKVAFNRNLWTQNAHKWTRNQRKTTTKSFQTHWTEFWLGWKIEIFDALLLPLLLLLLFVFHTLHWTTKNEQTNWRKTNATNKTNMKRIL